MPHAIVYLLPGRRAAGADLNQPFLPPSLLVPSLPSLAPIACPLCPSSHAIPSPLPARLSAYSQCKEVAARFGVTGG